MGYPQAVSLTHMTHEFDQKPVVEPDGWLSVSGLTKADAEQLLDQLEAHGISRREVLYQEAQGFTVRWKPERDPQ